MKIHKSHRLSLLAIMFLFSLPHIMAENQQTRNIKSFDTGWSFKKDNIVSGQEKASFDASSWRKVDLPHDWSIEDLPNQIPDSIIGPFSKGSIGTIQTGYTVGGTAWYRNSFNVSSKDLGKTVYIQFDGVYMNSDVWINGHHLGNHPNGYTPFYYDLTQYLQPVGKENIIAVQVKNEGVNSRWYSGSGIYRHVWLTMVNPLHIAVWGTYITTPNITKTAADIQVVTTLKNESKSNSTAIIQTQLIDSEGKIVGTKSENISIPAGGKTDVKQTIAISNPLLWSSQSPNLYKAKIAIRSNKKEEDAESTTFGVREIKIDTKNGLLVNGISVKLKGACVHHDYGPLGSATIERAEEHRIELLKANGFNAIRTSHNPPTQVFLDICDRMGMLVIDEAFDIWNKAKTTDDYHLYFKDWWDRDITSMLLRDRNHPSIILWSIGNELPDRADSIGLEAEKMLINRVRELDNTRMVTEAVCRTPQWDKKTPAIFEQLDVAGYNYQLEKYEGNHQKYPERIIVGTESYPMKALEFWQMAENNSYILGNFVWTAIDYMGEVGCGSVGLVKDKSDRVEWKWPVFNSYCGDIDLIGNKKPASYYRDVVWRNSKIEMFSRKPVPNGMTEFVNWWGWPDIHKSWNWHGEEGKRMNVIVYTRCQSVKLELNGKVIGEQKVPKNSITVQFDVQYQPGTLVAKGYDNGTEVASSILKTTGDPVAIRLKADRNRLKADRNDLSYVSVEIVDANGNLVPNAEDIEVNYTITGNGELAGVGNGNPVDVSSFQQPKKKVWHGKGLAIIRPKGAPGKVTLKANAIGLKEGSVEVIMK